MTTKKRQRKEAKAVNMKPPAQEAPKVKDTCVIEEYKGPNASVFKMAITGDKYKALEGKVFSVRAAAENSVRMVDLQTLILRDFGQLKPEIAEFLAYASIDRPTQLKSMLNTINRYLNETDIDTYDLSDYPMELVTATVRGKGLREAARQFLFDEGHRDVAENMEFFLDAIEAMVEGTKPEEEPIEGKEPVTE